MALPIRRKRAPPSPSPDARAARTAPARPSNRPTTPTNPSTYPAPCTAVSLPNKSKTKFLSLSAAVVGAGTVPERVRSPQSTLGKMGARTGRTEPTHCRRRQRRNKQASRGSLPAHADSRGGQFRRQSSPSARARRRVCACHRAVSHFRLLSCRRCRRAAAAEPQGSQPESQPAAS